MGNAYLAITGHAAIFQRSVEQVYADGIDIFLEGLTLRPIGPLCARESLRASNLVATRRKTAEVAAGHCGFLTWADDD